MIIRKHEIEFLNEAIEVFENDETLSTWQDEDRRYIALRTSFNFCRDSVLVLETRNVAEFVNVLPESSPLILGNNENE